MKKACTLFASLALVLAFSGFSRLAFADDRIDTVSLTVTEAGSLIAGGEIGEVTVTSADSRYYVESARFLNNHQIWQRNERPKVRVELYTDEYYRFARSSKSYFDLDGYGAEFASARILDGGTFMELDLYLERVTGEGGSSQLDYSLAWSGNTALWESDYGTDECEVRLYRWNTSGSQSSVVTTKRIALGEYDFTSYLTQSGYYTFRVRPYDAGFDSSQMWSAHSERLYVSRDEAIDNQDDDYEPGFSEDYGGPGGSYESGASYGSGPGYSQSNPAQPLGGLWQKDGTGWWYRYDNGGWPFSSWQLIGSQWYYFNAQGYLQTGWIPIGDKWYYSFSDGSMATGWQKIGPYWYYLANTGQMAVGWTQVGGAYYYLDPQSGAMWAGCFTPDGHYVNANGVRLY